MTPSPTALPDWTVTDTDAFPSLKSYIDMVDEPTFAERLVEWLPVLAGVAVGVVIGAVAMFFVLRARRDQ